MELKAVIFDFNGVIIDDEPLHFELFHKVLHEEGILLTLEDYQEKYLGFDDRGCFTEALCDNSRTPDAANDRFIQELIDRKASYYRQAIEERFLLFPGATDLIRKTSAKFPLAIASGALRDEIELVLSRGGIRDCFKVIVAAEDVTACKPDPEGYIKAHESLIASLGSDLEASECLVIEDSVPGIDAAKAAGMKCLAVTNSYGREELRNADEVVSTLENLDLVSIFREMSSHR